MPWRGPCYRLMGWRAGIPPSGETGGIRERCKGRDGHPPGRRGPCLPNLRNAFEKLAIKTAMRYIANADLMAMGWQSTDRSVQHKNVLFPEHWAWDIAFRYQVSE